MGVRVTFLRPSDGNDNGAAAAQPVTLVPKAALRTEGDQAYVFVINGDLVERRAVRTGGSDGDRLEVVGGLRPGEQVVMAPPADLANGARVRIKS